MKLREVCAACAKKINITNRFACHCNKIFCPEHRYMESHNCPMIQNKIVDEKNKLKSEMPKIETVKIEAL